jgi:hypothetical protein
MSAIVSSVQELIFQAFGWRTRNLRRTIERMLADDVYKNEIGRRVYRHPLLNGAGGARKQLTHIEPETFAIAVATAVQPAWSTGDPIAAMPQSVDALRDGGLKEKLELIIPQPKEGENYRETINQALITWFNTSMTKAGNTYKADAKVMAYGIAAAATVALNVSPIEIGQRMMNDQALRTSIGSAIPQMAPLLSAAAGSDSTTDAMGLLATNPQAANLFAVLKCRESQTSLPIGWPWMAGVLDSFGRSSKPDAEGETVQTTPQTSILSEEDRVCGEAVRKVEADGNLKSLVASNQFEREYGPNFKTDPAWMILLGWLITVLAAAQGAPFWFNLIQKVVRR